MKKLYLTVFLFIICTNIYPQEINVAKINGFEMYYEVHGTGNPMILLHGFFSQGKWWNFVIDDLSQHFQLIIPDLRGHGRSTNPLEHWTMEQSAKDIFALMDKLGIKTISGIGVSTGAKTLLHMATQNPGRVKAMVLIGGTMYYPELFRETIKSGSFTIDKVTDENWKNLRTTHVHGDEQIRKLYRQFNECAEDFSDMAFTPPSLSKIEAKTLIIHGDRDWAYPVSMAFEMHKSIPNSYLWVVPNGGHVPIAGKHANTFLNTTMDFMSKWEVNENVN